MIHVDRLRPCVQNRRYLVVPGYVESRTDRDRHWISAHDLMRLYCVKPEECMIDDGKLPFSGQLRARLQVLTPRYDGDYPIFRKSKPTQQCPKPRL
jgi:hypothetical protein